MLILDRYLHSEKGLNWHCSAVFIIGDKDGSKITSVFATTGSYPDQAEEISYADTKVIGNGSFGVVYQARIVETNDMIAIKKVLQDRRFKNRELQIMRKLDHCNIVKLRYFFYTSGDKVCRPFSCCPVLKLVLVSGNIERTSYCQKGFCAYGLLLLLCCS